MDLQNLKDIEDGMDEAEKHDNEELMKSLEERWVIETQKIVLEEVGAVKLSEFTILEDGNIVLHLEGDGKQTCHKDTFISNIKRHFAKEYNADIISGVFYYNNKETEGDRDNFKFGGQAEIVDHDKICTSTAIHPEINEFSTSCRKENKIFEQRDTEFEAVCEAAFHILTEQKEKNENN